MMRRLLVYAPTEPQFKAWCRFTGLTTREALYFSRYTHAEKARGLDAENLGIVRLGNPPRSWRHEEILEIYVALGAKTFDANDHATIRAWLRPEEEAHEDDRPALHVPDLLHRRRRR